MNLVEYLVSARPALRSWNLVRPTLHQALPLSQSQTDVIPEMAIAVSLCRYAEGQKILELNRLSRPWNDPDRWQLQLSESMLMLLQGRSDDAWHALQLNLSWRNHCEAVSHQRGAVPQITIRDWLAMATVAVAVGQLDTAEKYASKAVARIDESGASCLSDVLRDTRADAMTVFATVRLAQHRFQEAETLLELACEAHENVGDHEQLAVDLIYMSDIEFHGGQRRTGVSLLYTADRILRQQCDSRRHFRKRLLEAVIHDRLVEAKAVVADCN